MRLIDLQGVSVDFVIYQGSGQSLRKTLISAGTGGVISHDVQHRMFVRALSDVSFSLKQGDCVGLIGSNGAGKSTLLRVLAGVYEPTVGRARVMGSVTPMFDIFQGLDMDASGYDNISLRSIYLNVPRSQLEGIVREVADFTELGDYLTLPIRTYSTGMIMRLAFGIATTVKSDVLLLDEWLTVGDASFLRKAQERANRFVNQSSVLVIATHDESILEGLCNKAIWLNKGRMAAFGAVDEVLRDYRKSVQLSESAK